MTALNNFQKFYSRLSLNDLPLLREIYSDDGVLIDPVGRHQGLAQVTAYFTHLLANNDHCEFTIHSIGKIDHQNSQETALHDPKMVAELYAVTWTMKFATPALQRGRLLHVDGMSQLTVIDDKITHHHDFYDLGQMVYEHIPLLGSLIKKIKGRLRQ